MAASFPPLSPGGSTHVTLTGWKEIAAYFGRGVRTVQRWEKTLGLPVHRMGTGKAETVQASEAELRVWLAANLDRRDLNDAPEDSPQDELPRVVDPATPRPVAPGRAAAAVGRPWPRRAVPRWAAAAALTLLVFAAILVVAAWRRMPGPQPSRAKTDADVVDVYDADGRRLWRRTFDLPVRPAGFYDEALLGVGARRVIVEDLDGDGSREVVLFATANQTTWPIRVVGYDARGHLLFSHSPSQSVRFGDTDYGPPWMGYGLHVVQVAGKRQLWVSWIHLKSGNFPSLLQRLSPTGKVEAEYWSAGYVELVASIVVNGAPFIVVGAANNDHHGASLAVFDAGNVEGSAPADTADKTCRNCPPGGPRAFLVFPRMAFMERMEWFPAVVEVRQHVNGELRVFVTQSGLDIDGTRLLGAVFYDLAPDLTPVRAEISDDYKASYRRLEQAGRAPHPFGDLDRASVWPVLVWKGPGTPFVPVTGVTDK